jgi:isopentenyl diphosphate isomerase/L-lactate dehydrogenase-like FMN-dependent dehydrogenase
VAHVLSVIRSDIDVAMGLTGTTDVADIDCGILLGSD